MGSRFIPDGLIVRPEDGDDGERDPFSIVDRQSSKRLRSLFLNLENRWETLPEQLQLKKRDLPNLLLEVEEDRLKHAKITLGSGAMETGSSQLIEEEIVEAVLQQAQSSGGNVRAMELEPLREQEFEEIPPQAQLEKAQPEAGSAEGPKVSILEKLVMH
ncbi:hypothetical protein R1flu_022367 [Riccia fluitans]|uniref:Uncharacterized protein n=1 Tax=Riccia fluitans TaxID=41844 RepID=A0ABD1ZS26_9MARC